MPTKGISRFRSWSLARHNRLLVFNQENEGTSDEPTSLLRKYRRAARPGSPGRSLSAGRGRGARELVEAIAASAADDPPLLDEVRVAGQFVWIYKHALRHLFAHMAVLLEWITGYKIYLCRDLVTQRRLPNPPVCSDCCEHLEETIPYTSYLRPVCGPRGDWLTQTE